MAKSIVITKDTPHNNKNCTGIETRKNEQKISWIHSIGITKAPTRQSERLKQIIRRLEVFRIDCFVAKKETIKVTLTVKINGQLMP